MSMKDSPEVMSYRETAPIRMKLEDLQSRYAEFVSERDWGKFHTPQNLAQAISVESNELLENFLWMNNPSTEAINQDAELRDDIREEMADVLIYLLGLANQLEIDLLEAVDEKMADNVDRFDEDTVGEINSNLERWQ